MLRALLACLVPFALAIGAVAQSMPTATKTYAKLGTFDLDLDIYTPTPGTPPYPVVVYVHGGGWQGGSRYPLPSGAEALLAAGVAVVSIDYRLTSNPLVSYSSTFPGQIHDVKAAIRWVRANAVTYMLDATRIGIFGQSAGGHLSALATLSGGSSSLEGTVGTNLTQSSAVSVGAAFFGVYDFYHLQGDVTTPPGSSWNHNDPSSPESALFGWNGVGQGLGDIIANWSNPTAPYPALVKLVKDASPVSWVDANDPPLLFMHGSVDPLVPVNQSSRLSATLFASGVRHDFRAIPGEAHRPFLDEAEAALVSHFVSFFAGTTPPVAGTRSCFGYDSVSTVCPCSGAGDSLTDARQGCRNSLRVGARLDAEGVASLGADTLLLRGVGMSNNTAFYRQSTTSTTPAAFFNNGVSCLSGTITTLGSALNGKGFSEFPPPGGPTLSGPMMFPIGQVVHYECVYFDSTTLYCTSGPLNVSSMISVTWAP